MKTDKLQNILRDLDERLRRSEGRVLSASSNPDSARGMLTRFSHLRSNIRRLSSKPDALSFAEVQALDFQIDQLGDAAARTKTTLLTSDPLYRVMAEIFEDSAYLSRLTSGLKIGLNQVTPDDLLESTPGQKTAAFQFAYNNDLLVVIDQPFQSSERDRDIALAALQSAAEHGEHINTDLEGTNVSPRLRHAFAVLQKTLESHSNVVQVGQQAQLCGRMVNADIGELSGSLAGLLLGHVEMVFNTLSQFEDWRVFCENAASSAFTSETVDGMLVGTRELIVSFRESPSVSPAVVQALETVASWAEDGKTDKRDLLSLARTIENAMSVVIRSALHFAKDVGTVVRKRAVSGTAWLLIGAAATFIVPALSKVPGAEWLQPASAYLKGLASSSGPSAP
ncbi:MULTISPECIES: hypothetical protein [Agrobacterium]|uniref:hypothetical protein n=1 Tax=Agrobacterium TaxID=357 RepID=UPI0022B847A8|nr:MULTISPECIES: hypothetical protein [Agrobacterium]MCZ7887150.1 hypothetical protein [Agrobacterium salinitolerans]MDA5631093.1 hypothetical protein [Agrobacterium sp. ST15.16.055]MDA6980360.1 hypothetical protein [Agrobacterium salinitolerans]